MADRHKHGGLSWHPRSAGDVTWLRLEAEHTGQPLARLLDEALSLYRAFGESVAEGPDWALRLQERLEGEQPARRPASQARTAAALAQERAQDQRERRECPPHPRARVTKGFCSLCKRNVGSDKVT